MDFFILIRNLVVAIVLAVALLVGLFSAPWQVLLIILIAGVVMSQWLIERHHLQGEIRDIGNLDASQALTNSSEGLEEADLSAEQHHSPTLSYRGANYTPSANTSEKDTEVDAFEALGKYRGGLSSLHIAHTEH